MANITLTRLTENDQFILDNQFAFKYGAMEEFGKRDDHCEKDGEIISRKTIEDIINNGAAYRIREDGTQQRRRHGRLEGSRASIPGDQNLGNLHSVL